jgi:hypothetical protein
MPYALPSFLTHVAHSFFHQVHDCQCSLFCWSSFCWSVSPQSSFTPFIVHRQETASNFKILSNLYRYTNFNLTTKTTLTIKNSSLGVLDTTLCDKVYQWFATGQWFSPSTPVFSTNKTDRYIVERDVKHHKPSSLAT